jgi:hypothetical protein
MLLKIQRKVQKYHVVYGAQRRAPLTPVITYCFIDHDLLVRLDSNFQTMLAE